jgi:hypothetical protein
MDLIERALSEHGASLAGQLADVVGLTRQEAEVFLREAGPALIDSWRWQADRMGADVVHSQDGVRDLLAGISGRRLAPRVGLTSERTWEGLRVLVPAVVRASVSTPGASGVSTPAASADRRMDDDSEGDLDIGFGLRVGRTGARHEAGRDWHPIFGRLLRAEDGLA